MAGASRHSVIARQRFKKWKRKNRKINSPIALPAFEPTGIAATLFRLDMLNKGG